MNRPSPRRPISRLVFAIPIALLLALPGSAFAVVGTCESLPGGVIEVEGTGGSGTQPTGYATLGAAFTAVNTGVHTGGTIAIDVCGDTAEGTATATLNASGSGAALYTAITISPVGGAARTISGATTAGSPLIDLNGADAVTIDGLNTGGNSLTISNTTASATSGTSTIRFIGGATGNTITNSTILGSFSAAVATNGGNIVFSTDANTANGNDNNTISSNNIGPAGASLPTKGVYFNGSTTTTAINNSGNVITGNNIFDYFGAAVSSAGIYVAGGTTDCTFTNNKFYQTATRTQTTGAQHSAIWVINGNNYLVSGNTIGFASSAGTGTYTFVGVSSSSVLIPIYLNVGTVTNTSVQGNTIAGIAMSGLVSGTSSGAPFRGIYIGGGVTTVGDVTGNTIGSQSATGSITFTSSSSSAADVIGIFNFGSSAWTASNNLIGGITAGNSSTGAANVFGIRVNTSSGVTFTCQNNTIGGTVANSIQSTSTATGTTVQGIKNDNPIGTITGNTVRNLTAAGGTGTTTGASVIGISVTTSSSNQTVSQNTIFNLSNTNTTAATIVTGIQFTGSTANVVARNLIHSLTSATNSATAEVNGIRVGGGTTVYRNNMIALGAGIANALGTAATNSSTTGVNGINEFLGTDSFFHNSVYIGGAPTAGSGPSFAFNGTQTTNVRSFRDNIFFNARSNAGATGKNYAIKINGTTANPTGLTINNNLYFANGTGAVFGFFNSLDVANLAAWKAAVGQDAVSFESNPQYLDPTNSIPDLHLHPTNPTVAEGNGFDVGVTDDYDGQTRSGLTPVDIGADAGNFAGIDLAPPVISYTALGNTISTANRLLTASITDGGSGVPTAGAGLPVIYFRKGVAGAFASTQASSGGGGTYNFTIDYSLVTGGSVAIGDTIQYYVVAQDGAATPNVTSSPAAGASGYTANPPAAATPPTTPNSYLISAPITGIKTVCASGCDYTTLTGAAGIFAAINTNVVTGNVEIQIAGDLIVGEDGTVGLNAPSEDPPGSNYSVKIYPTGVPRAITGAFNGALVRLAGASRVTIDGSIGGTGTDRSLTIQNTSVTTPSVVLIGSTGTTPVTNDTLKNCIIINGVNTNSAVVISDSTTLGNAGYFSNITIQNNDIQKAYIGVYANGGTTPQNGSNLTYSQNSLNTVGANAIRLVGLYMQGVNGATVSQNSLGNFSNSDGENDTGIWLATGTANAAVSNNTVTNLGMTLTTGFAPYGIRESSGLTASGSTISGNTVTNVSTTGSTAVRGIAASGGGVTVERNKIQGIINNNTGTFGSFGIDVTAGNNDVIKNNFVSDVNHNMSGGAAFGPDFGVVGIRLGAGTGHKVYANSVNLFGPHTGTATTSLLSAAFSISATTQTGIDVRDNIFANSITGGTTSIAHVSVYLPSAGTSAMNLTWNNNAYFFGPDALTQGVGQAGSTAGTNFYTTLPALAAYSSTLSGAGTNDNASLASTGAVPFTSASDLHLLPGSPMLQLGVTLSGVTDDIDGDPRPASAPDIGADEIVQIADVSITKTDGVNSVAQGGTATYTITASNAGPSAAPGTLVTDSFPAGCTSVSWTCTPSGGATCTAGPVSGNISDTASLPVGGSAVYTATCTVSPSATGSLVNTATVATAAGITDPTPGNDSATDTDTIASLADLSITKTDGVTSASPGNSVTYTITVSNAGPNADPFATVSDAFPPECTSASYTSVASGGASGNTASGAGNIGDILSLPAGGGVVYTATCNISGSASGSLSNTATVASSLSDPNLANNSATDTDTLSPSADLSITKTDGVTTATAGGTVTYTIVATNPGPSGAPGSLVTDAFPPGLSCSTTCVGAGGGSCTAGPFTTPINDTVNLPADSNVTYTSVCTVAVDATGSIRNTATVATGSGVTDPTPSNNSATDEDVIPGTALFSDGFETGNTSRWGGAQTLFHAYQVLSVSGSTIEAGYDLAGLPGFAFESSAIAEVAGEGGQAMFRLVARRTDANAAVELSLEVVGGGSSAWVAASGSQLRFDWTAGSAGHVALAIDGRLALWVDGFATSAAPVTLELRRSE